MEDNAVGPMDATWSIEWATPQTHITEITVPDTHIMQEPDNDPTRTHEDPLAILIDTPQPMGREPSHTPVSEGETPDIEISSRSNNSLSLAHTITKLADSVSKLNQLLDKEREKSERLLCENLILKTKILELQSRIENIAVSGTSHKGNDYIMARKAMEIRTRLISDAERFHRNEDSILQSAIETYNKEHSINNKTQTAMEIKANKTSRSAEGDRNQVIKAASGRNSKNSKSNNNSSGKNRPEQQQKQDFLPDDRTRNRTNKQSPNKIGKEQHPSELKGSKKKLNLLIVGDSQLQRVDESKLSNRHRDVETRFQPGMRIGQAVDKSGKSNNNDVIIVHAATNNVASSTPEKLCDETVRTLKQIQANNPKAKVAFSSIFKRKDNMALNNTVK